MATKARRISPREWETQKSRILELVPDYTIEEVIRTMRDKYGFIASLSQYEAKLKTWNATKNLKKSEWRVILEILDELESQGKQYQVRNCGRIVTEPRIQRARRYFENDEKGTQYDTDKPSVKPRNVTIMTLQPDQQWAVHTNFERIGNKEVGESISTSPTEIPTRDNLDFGEKWPSGADSTVPSNNINIPIRQDYWSDTICFLGGSPRLPAELDFTLEITKEIQCSSLNDPNLAVEWGPNLDVSTFEYSLPSNLDNITTWESTMIPFYTVQNNIISVDPFRFQQGLNDLPFSRYVRVLQDQSSRSWSVSQRDIAGITASNSLALFLSDIATAFTASSSPSIKDVLSKIKHSLIGLTIETFQVSNDSLMTADEMFESNFERLLFTCITNGLIGLDDIPIEGILRYLQRHTSSSSILWQFLKMGPKHLMNSLAEKIFRAALEAEDDVVLRQLLKFHPLDVNRVMNSRETPIETAARLQSFKVAEVLLSAGADVNKSNYAQPPYSTPYIISATGALGAYLSSCEFNQNPIDLRFVKLLLHFNATVCPKALEDVLKELDVLDENAHSVVEKMTLQVLSSQHSVMISGGILWRMVQRLDDDVCAEYIRITRITCERIGCSNCFRIYGEETHWTLMEAARRGLIHAVEQLLPHSKCLSQVLSAAISSRNLEVVHQVLHLDPEISCKPHYIHLHNYGEFRDGFLVKNSYPFSNPNIGATTPLAEAILTQDEHLIGLMENRGALDNISLEGRISSAIAAAVEVGCSRYLSKLLRLCPEPTQEQLSRPLLVAIQVGNTECMQTLLDLGANVNMASTMYDSDGSYEKLWPLEVALLKRDEVSVELLLNTQILSGTVGIITTVFGAAVKWGSIPILEKIQAVFPKVFEVLPAAYDRYRLSPHEPRKGSLAAVLKDGQLPLFRYLVESGIAGEKDLNSCLIFALDQGNEILLDQLLEQGADPFHPSTDMLEIYDESRTQPPLLFSERVLQRLLRVAQSEPRRIRRLVEVKVLELALNLSPPATELIVEVLKGKEIDPNKIIRSRGSTLFGLAIKAQFESMKTRLDVMSMFIESGAEPNSLIRQCSPRSDSNETALLAAIKDGDEELVKLLVKEGARVNQEAKFGLRWTPLQKASMNGNLAIVTILLIEGALVNDEPAYSGGGTALQCAAMSGSCTVAALLLENGANLEAPPSKVRGCWPLEGAARYGRVEMVEYLWKVSAQNFPKSQCLRAMKLAEDNGHLACRDYIAERSGFSLLMPESSDECL